MLNSVWSLSKPQGDSTCLDDSETLALSFAEKVRLLLSVGHSLGHREHCVVLDRDTQ